MHGPMDYLVFQINKHLLNDAISDYQKNKANNPEGAQANLVGDISYLTAMAALEEAAKKNPRLMLLPWATMLSKPAVQAITAGSYKSLFHAYSSKDHTDGKSLLAAFSREVRAQYERDRNQLISGLHELFDFFKV